MVALIGTARPSPKPATAVLTPTTRARLSARAPPELPGLRAASVWMTSSTTRRARPRPTGSERPSAETTPAVTEPARPKGLPIATTSWPTVSRSASPSVAAGRSRALGAEHGKVGERVRADEREGQVAAVGEARPQAAAGALDDVGRGEQEAVGRDHDAAAAPLPLAAAAVPPHDPDARDGRPQRARDRAHRA